MMKKLFSVFIPAIVLGVMLTGCDVTKSEEYQQRKAELKEINRMNNAHEPVESDKKIKELVAYFEEHGTESDRLKAHFVAGATYRDLQDSPRALEHFFKVVDAFDDGAQCDSVLLLCTFSELHFQYCNVQDYDNALKMARKEYALDLVTGGHPIISSSHVGVSLLYLGREAEAEKYFLISLSEAEKHPEETNDDCFPLLLYNLSRLGNKEAARRCFALTDRESPLNVTDFALAEYFEEIEENTDSAEFYCRKILDSPHTIADEYDAYKFLFILNMNRNQQKAIDYATRYVEVCDSFDLGKRQQLAATVNNQHQYHRDMAAEQKLVKDRARMQKWFIVTIFSSIVVILLGTILFLYKKYRHTRAMLEKDEQLRQTSDELADRKRQLSDFLHQMHQTELSHTAEDVVESIRQAAEGKHKMSAEEWVRLYQAIDQLHPTFADRLVHSLTSFTEQQKQVLYLLRLGLTNTQIENVTNLSHTTVWRWVKKFKGVVE